MSKKKNAWVDEYGDPKWGKIIALVIAVLFVIITLCGAISIVPTGYVGIRATFGQISEQPVSQGINFKIPFVQSIKKVSCKLQDETVKAQVWGETNDKTPVYAEEIIVSYKISPDKATWLYRNISDTKSFITQELVASAVKSAMIELDVTTVTNRSHIEPLVKQKLNQSLAEKYGEDAVSVEKVVINSMDFEENYNAAIQAKSIATQQKEEQAIKNETAIAKAEADKKVAIANAEAQAEAKRIAADAEAEANKKIADSLDSRVLENRFYDSWDGKLPTVMGEGTAIVDVAGSRGGSSDG